MKNKKIKSSKKFRFSWKYFWISIFSLGIAGILIGCFANWKNPKWIFIAGSSTMQPLLTEISKNYHSNVEVSTNSGGSSYGISSVLNNTKNIGTVSKSPEKTAVTNGKFNQNWINDKIKTITIGKDPIGIIYKSDSDLVIDKNNINNLYKAFCGYEQINFSSLDGSASNLNKKIVPFARTGGAKESGTSEAFLYDSNLDPNLDLTVKSPTTMTIKEVLSSGQYGKNTFETNESSLETWQAIKSYSGEGVPMTYLSGGFIKTNYDEITKSGFKIAKYQTNDNSLLNGDSFNQKYNWFRPLNLVTKTTADIQTKMFIQWIVGNMLFIDSQLINTYNNIGFMYLNYQQLRTMCFGNNNVIDKINSNINKYKSYDEYLSSNPNLDWSSFWQPDNVIWEQQRVKNDQSRYYCGAIL